MLAEAKNLQLQHKRFQKEGTMKSIDVIGFFDDFAQRVTQPTLVVLYNASIHKSNEFKANIERWRKKDLFL